MVGHGLTSCATCDGAFYKNVPVCVVGGGDSAAEESLFLTRFASKVYLIHRRDKMRASKIMQERVFANKKIEPIWDTVVTQYIADEKGEMRGVRGGVCATLRLTRNAIGGGMRLRCNRT